MKEQFADYETSKMLKELRFDEVCLSFYSNYNQQVNRNDSWDMGFTSKDLTKDFMECLAPTWQQVKQWLWENHKWRISIRRISKEYTYEIWNQNNAPIEYGVKYDSPINAEIVGIKQAIQYLHKNKKS